MKVERKEPSFGYALMSFVLVLALVLGCNHLLGAPLQAMFMISWLLIIPLCMHLGYTYNEIWSAMMESVKNGMSAILILLAVGAMIGCWTACGAVPTIIYAGLNVINPRMFLLTTFLLCSFISIACGTSWGTLGTAGIAMFAIGESLGIPSAMTVGAIVSGSYLGDMLSPMSDSTNVASASVGSELITHCKELLYIVVPAFLISAAIYALMGVQFTSMNFDQSYIQSVIASMKHYFRLGLVAIIPVITLFILLFMKKPSFPSMVTSALIGLFIAVVWQGASLNNIFGYFWKGYSIETGEVFLDKLLNRGGVSSMFGSGAFMLFCFGMAGAFNKAGILQAIINPIASKAKKPIQLTLVTQIISTVGNMMGTNTFTILMCGTLMGPVYKKEGLHPTNCSKVMNCTSTVVTSLIPWSVDGVYIFGLFGVATINYGMYSLYAWIVPLMALLFVILGIRVIPANVNLEAGEKYHKAKKIAG